jgi:hypothetical protein
MKNKINKKTFTSINVNPLYSKELFYMVIFLLFTFHANSQIKTDKEIKRIITLEKQIGEIPILTKLKEENPEIKKSYNLFQYGYFTNNDDSRIRTIGLVGKGAEFINYKDYGCSASAKVENIEVKDTLKYLCNYKLPECIEEAYGIDFTHGNVVDFMSKADRTHNTNSQQDYGLAELIADIQGTAKAISEWTKGELCRTSLYPVIDGTLRNKHSIVGPFVASKDLNHLAYLGIGRENAIYKYKDKGLIIFDTTKAVVYYDNTIGKEYKYVNFSSLKFSPDSKHFVYSAQLENNKWTVVYDGIELKYCNYINDLTFSPNSEHFAYRAIDEDKANWNVIFDGKALKKYYDICWLTFSPNSEHFVYRASPKKGIWRVVIDSTESKDYLDILAFAFSPDGTHFVYGASSNKGLWRVVLDGKESEEYLNLYKFIFSPDGKHFAYLVKKGKNLFVVVDGKPQNSDKYCDIYPSTIKFSTDCNKLSYCAKKGNKWVMVIDGIEQLENKGNPSASHFSPDNNTVYYIGYAGRNQYYFKNNIKVSKIPFTNTPDIIFADNGLYYAYIHDNRVFINGNKGQQYKRIWKLKFISDNEISYIADKNEGVYKIVEKIE